MPSLAKQFVAQQPIHDRSVGEILLQAGKYLRGYMKYCTSFGQSYHGVDDVAFQCATFSHRDSATGITMNVLVFFTDDRGNAVIHD